MSDGSAANTKTGRTVSGLTRRQVILLLGPLATGATARANEETIDMSHAVFVAMAGSQRVPFIDPDTDRIAGSIDVGMVPDQVEVASSISKRWRATANCPLRCPSTAVGSVSIPGTPVKVFLADSCVVCH